MQAFTEDAVSTPCDHETADPDYAAFMVELNALQQSVQAKNAVLATTRKAHEDLLQQLSCATQRALQAALQRSETETVLLKAKVSYARDKVRRQELLDAVRRTRRAVGRVARERKQWAKAKADLSGACRSNPSVERWRVHLHAMTKLPHHAAFYEALRTLAIRAGKDGGHRQVSRQLTDDERGVLEALVDLAVENQTWRTRCETPGSVTPSSSAPSSPTVPPA